MRSLLCFAHIGAASLCNTPSYVDIKAKTDTYVGFLPANALERLLEKRPIVLLTLAKRLISLLSPLGTQLVDDIVITSDITSSAPYRWFSRLGTGQRRASALAS